MWNSAWFWEYQGHRVTGVVDYSKSSTSVVDEVVPCDFDPRTSSCRNTSMTVLHCSPTKARRSRPLKSLPWGNLGVVVIQGVFVQCKSFDSPKFHSVVFLPNNDSFWKENLNWFELTIAQFSWRLFHSWIAFIRIIKGLSVSCKGSSFKQNFAIFIGITCGEVPCSTKRVKRTVAYPRKSLETWLGPIWTNHRRGSW